MALEGTVKTPFGVAQKKTVLVLVGGAAGLGAIVWYRQRNLGGSDTAVPTDGEINPATGYVYGSPEDAAALTALQGYQSPIVNDPTGGGSGSTPPSNIGYASNGQWVQGVISYMTSNGLVEDPSKLSSALGKYITGSAPTDEEKSLITQAIAVQGYPPIAGPSGFPPNINTSAPVPPSTNPTMVAPPGLKLLSAGPTSLRIDWGTVPNAKGYRVTKNGAYYAAPFVTSVEIYGLKKNTTYRIAVQAVAPNGTYGPASTISPKTKVK